MISELAGLLSLLLFPSTPCDRTHQFRHHFFSDSQLFFFFLCFSPFPPFLYLPLFSENIQQLSLPLFSDIFFSTDFKHYFLEKPFIIPLVSPPRI